MSQTTEKQAEAAFEAQCREVWRERFLKARAVGMPLSDAQLHADMDVERFKREQSNG